MRALAVLALAATVTGTSLVLAAPASAEEFTPFRASPDRTTAAQGERVVITGRTAASSGIPGPVFPGPGDRMCLYRKAGPESWRLLDICTTVGQDRRFRLRAYLGILGTFSYVVGETDPRDRAGMVLDDDDMAGSNTFRITTTR